MDMALNNLQWLICHETKPTKPTSVIQFTWDPIVAVIYNIRGILASNYFFIQNTIHKISVCTGLCG